MIDCIIYRRWENEPELRIIELEHCFVQLNRNQFFPGYCFVFIRELMTELFHLASKLRQSVIEEVNRVAAALFQTYKLTKMNDELLRKMVPHMHWHLIPRFSTETLWPRPIWSEPHTEKTLTSDQYRTEIEQINRALKQSVGVSS